MKYKNIVTISLLVVASVVGVFGYLRWKDQKEFLELIRASASSTQKRNIERMLAPQLSFAPELQERVVLGVLESAQAEVLEKIPAGENQVLVRYRLSLLSEAGARELAARFLKSVEEKKVMGTDEIAQIIKGEIDKSIPRQVFVGEMRVSKNEGRWTAGLEAIQ